MAIIEEDVSSWFPMEMLDVPEKGYTGGEDPYDPDPYE